MLNTLDRILIAAEQAQKLYRLYDHFQRGNWTTLVAPLVKRVIVPRFTPSANIAGTENALGVNACSGAIWLDHCIATFVEALAGDDRISRITPQFRATLDAARMTLRRFVSDNFDQATIDKSAESVGLEELCTIKSKLPKNVGFSADNVPGV